jgi:flagellar basal body-associated protein FliL
MTTDHSGPPSQHNVDQNGSQVSQDSGKRLIKLVVASALLLVVAVFVVVLLVSGRTDDDQPEQPQPAVTVSTTG